MQASDIRELKDDEIQRSLTEKYEELWGLRFKHASNQLADTSRIKVVRKEIARLQTVLRERELWAAYEAQQEQ